MRHAPYSSFSPALPHGVPVVPAPVSRGRAILAAVLRILALPYRVAAIRRDMALLGQMSGRELADIGLGRQDLWDAAALPLGQPPGPLFTRRAAERRRAGLQRR